MVHVPILGIDIPEPRLSDIIPGTVSALVHALHAAYTFLDDLIRPLPPDAKEAYNKLAIGRLPIEIRKARKRIKAEKLKDPDVISSEIEDAAYDYYRRMLRENVAGFADERTEDVCYRKLVDPSSAKQNVWEQYEAQQASALAQDEQQQPPNDAQLAAARLSTQQAEQQHAEARAQAASARQAEASAQLPRPAARAAATGASGALGLALGVGVMKLVRLVARQRRRRRVAQTASAAAASAAAAAATSAQLPPRPKGSRPSSGKGTKGAAGSKQRGAGSGGGKGSGNGRSSPRPPRQT